ncbi:hypothetical protein N7468_009067 [Penicillium chermesinum]|uniref:DNA-(apurinic or apyrimidinic site) endonuclease 2 n=1 Tax=Penicillium chermesinum TaxID=63820 RepID=A0A9W9NJQ6_9EURO|nr:uncharacterized protein N7468_009067 [Penicillium chermesinum]KAJ5219863.1 hypothetical protein N7468_009067 [Penicillium chermesinum]
MGFRITTWNGTLNQDEPESPGFSNTDNEEQSMEFAEEGITGVLCPPNSELAFRDMPKEQQIGGYPTFEQLTMSSTSGTESDTGAPNAGSPASEARVDPATLDSEGRCVVLEFPAFVLIGVYCPAYRDESRDSFRMDFLNALDARVRNLVTMGKRVVVTGDINIAKGGIDSASAMEGIRKGTTTEEEYISGPSWKLFNSLLADGVVVGERMDGREEPVLHDICRSFHPERTGMYTCWDTRLNTRPGNYGSRIDYVLCSLDMREWFCESNIQEGLMEGRRQQDYSNRLLLPASGRLLPEFDLEKRRSIKDMFARKPPASPNKVASAVNIPGRQELDVKNDCVAAPCMAEASRVPPVATSRKRQPPPSAAVTSKRSKPLATPTAAASGQKSLKGFFKPKGPAVDPKTETSESIAFTAAQVIQPTAMAADSEPDQWALQVPRVVPDALAATASGNSFMNASPDTSATDAVIDPAASKENWSKLFTRKPVPLCETHREPCISLTTKKPGMNCGRAFWICARPLGPSGEKEKGTQWRCPTFIWASDWNGSVQPDP